MVDFWLPDGVRWKTNFIANSRWDRVGPLRCLLSLGSLGHGGHTIATAVTWLWRANSAGVKPLINWGDPTVGRVGAVIFPFSLLRAVDLGIVSVITKGKNPVTWKNKGIFPSQPGLCSPFTDAGAHAQVRGAPQGFASHCIIYYVTLCVYIYNFILRAIHLSIDLAIWY